MFFSCVGFSHHYSRSNDARSVRCTRIPARTACSLGWVQNKDDNDNSNHDRDIYWNNICSPGVRLFEVTFKSISGISMDQFPLFADMVCNWITLTPKALVFGQSRWLLTKAIGQSQPVMAVWLHVSNALLLIS